MKQLLTTLLFFFCQQLLAQYNIIELGGGQGQFNAKELGINTNLVGVHFGIEFPLGTYSLRGGLDYLSRIGSAPSTGNSINNFRAFKLLGGKVFGEGHRLQFPLLIGASYFYPNSDAIILSDSSKNKFGVSAAAGLRFYLGNKFALFGQAVFDGGLLSDYIYKNSVGTEVKSNIVIRNVFICVGIAFVYRKEKLNSLWKK
jgi:hypothetical protein